MTPILGYEGQYSITADGRVWSHKRRKFRPAHKGRSGYLRITLRDSTNGHRPKSLLVHRLVAQAHIPNPANKPEVNHLNSVRDDNRVENLQWSTREENNQHAWDHGNKEFRATAKFLASVSRPMEVRNGRRRRVGA